MNRWNDSASATERLDTHGVTDRWQTWTDPTGSQIGLDEQLRLLTVEGRRHVIVCLASESGPMPLEALADCVVDRHRGSVDREEVLLRLHHVHLPRLAAAGLLSYEVEDGKVVGRPERLGAILELRSAAVG
ncbi:DUF7344 domain-containing protein [Haloglomus litoreum]|uniref:DUF7344 domain-containing protein n=1 Tax=Haloglomus litoreum TaxID=3034026 RepID=UPI0023E79995|nr:hypothetical protein [Haloglomus sp. DT116]